MQELQAGRIKSNSPHSFPLLSSLPGAAASSVPMNSIEDLPPQPCSPLPRCPFHARFALGSKLRCSFLSRSLSHWKGPTRQAVEFNKSQEKQRGRECRQGLCWGREVCCYSSKGKKTNDSKLPSHAWSPARLQASRFLLARPFPLVNCSELKLHEIPLQSLARIDAGCVP